MRFAAIGSHRRHVIDVSIDPHFLKDNDRDGKHGHVLVRGTVVYPPEEQAASRQALVEIKCVISAEGLTQDCHVSMLYGDRGFARAALSAASGTVFAPTGHPIPGLLQFHFILNPSYQIPESFVGTTEIDIQQ